MDYIWDHKPLHGTVNIITKQTSSKIDKVQPFEATALYIPKRGIWP